jgi:hypothetical protein
MLLHLYLKSLKNKNHVKAFFPKWGRSLSSDSSLRESGIDINYIDYNNISNSKLITGDVFIVPVNNDNVLRKLSKLEKSNAYLTALVQAQALNGTVLLIPSGDYKPTDSMKNEVSKTKATVCEIVDIQKKFVSAVSPKTVQSSYIAPVYSQPQVQSETTKNSYGATSTDNSNCYTCTTHDCISRCLSKVDLISKTGADRIGATLGNTEIPLNLASFIDHTLLKPEATESQVIQLCEEARKHSFASVCVNPAFVPLSAKLLRGSPVMVCTVIGFPLGATTSETKAFETRQAIAQGANEIDMGY